MKHKILCMTLLINAGLYHFGAAASQPKTATEVVANAKVLNIAMTAQNDKDFEKKKAELKKAFKEKAAQVYEEEAHAKNKWAGSTDTSEDMKISEGQFKDKVIDKFIEIYAALKVSYKLNNDLDGKPDRQWAIEAFDDLNKKGCSGCSCVIL